VVEPALHFDSIDRRAVWAHASNPTSLDFIPGRNALLRRVDCTVCTAPLACLAEESFHVEQPAVSHVSSLFHVEHTEHGFGPAALSRGVVSRETSRAGFSVGNEAQTVSG
jgi:hypothetical protein